MTPSVNVKSYGELPYNEREILRYAGCRGEDAQSVSLMRSCIEEARGVLTYKVCCCQVPVKVSDDGCDFGSFTVSSKDLAKNLSGCCRAVVFAATVGFGIDRLISKYTRLSPSRALMLQALGAERIEALCDAFCGEFEERGYAVRPRFSPGYGDAALSVQSDIFSLIDPPRKIGLCLGGNLLMSPTKSVTAFMGILKSDRSSACTAGGNV